MASLNKVFLIGNVGHDPELRYYPDGTPTVTISLATTESWKDKDSGEKVERTEWSRVVFNRGLAEVVGEYVGKGDPIHVEGKLRTRKWTDKDGVDKYVTEVHAQSMQMLGGKRAEGSAKPAKAQRSNTDAGDPLPPIDHDFVEDEIPF
jgi:single-strand DNA-binding protein